MNVVFLAAEAAPGVLTDPTVITLAVGAMVVPPLVALLNQRQWSAQTKALVAFLACLIAAAGLEMLRGPVSWSDWRRTAVVLTVAALGMYKLWWQPSGIAKSIEAKTTITDHGDDPYGGDTLPPRVEDPNALDRGYQPHRGVPPPAGL